MRVEPLETLARRELANWKRYPIRPQSAPSSAAWSREERNRLAARCDELLAQMSKSA